MSGRGAPGANSRGRGGKFKKFTRGGGKHFSRDLRPLDADGNEISMWSEDAQKADNDESEGEEDSDEEGSDAGPSQPNAELTREERKQAKKAQKEAAISKKKNIVQVGDLPSDSAEDDDDDDDGAPANPNHSKASRGMTKVQPGGVEEATNGLKNLAMSRKERESLEAQQAKERYRKLHEEGKTDEAKADLARLRLIREKREAEAARKQAEKEEREAQEKARRAEIEAKEAKKRAAALGKGAKKGKS
ncbi:hypothetical protein GGS23DRAFT_583204 [Durotheca rogersii]|uniref:uncharacterized protein n=1 Tax=Durotheca rogersii TaxID=419775 RepID=UPI00221EED1A|nr:uncharacterized protein GGS23DRAFT_583204 [Durotheca rogersii]KAI5859952.1 hypothetical protein GGS23DRAFT_583204 [Durotheca rogersii]